MRRVARRKPVALIANPGADLYGSDRMLIETVKAIVGAGWRAVVVLPTDGLLSGCLRSVGAEILWVRTPVVRKSALRAKGAAQLMGDFVAGVAPSVLALRTVKPDLVYVNTITLPLWLAMAKIVRCPIVCHIHEAESSAPGWLLRALNLPLFLADRLIANSEFSRGVVARVYAPLAKRVKVIRNAVPGPSEVTPAREVLESPYQLLYVGRLSPRKGAHVALAAIALLRARDIPVRLDIVGAVFPGYEWYEQQLREYVEDKQLGNVVRWHGFQADIWEYVARADVVVVPSTVDEPFGNTAVEAALGARPLVVSDLAGLKEAVNGVSAAVRVPPLSPGAMADAVEQICSNWTLYRLRAAEDCVFASYRYSTGTYAEQLLHVLSELRG